MSNSLRWIHKGSDVFNITFTQSTNCCFSLLYQGLNFLQLNHNFSFIFLDLFLFYFEKLFQFLFLSFTGCSLLDSLSNLIQRLTCFFLFFGEQFLLIFCLRCQFINNFGSLSQFLQT